MLSIKEVVLEFRAIFYDRGGGEVARYAEQAFAQILKRISSYFVFPVTMPSKKRCAEVDLSIYQLDAFAVGETCPRWPMMVAEAPSSAIWVVSCAEDERRWHPR